MDSQKIEQPNTLIRRVGIAALAAGFLIGGFAGGYVIGTRNAPSSPAQSPTSGTLRDTDKPLPKYLSKDVDFDLLWDVWKRVKRDYITKDTPDTKLFYGALEGIVGALDDPYSVFLDPETSKKFDESLSGSFEGIGAEIGIKKRQLQVIAPLPGTPAEQAGLRAGDKILEIDKKSTASMTVDEAVNRIRGKGGTKVILTIFRDTERKERDVTITRSMIEVASVTWKVRGDQFAEIKVSHFNQDTESRFRDAVRDVLKRRVKGVVVDLRNNPGGYLDTAVQLAGYWVDGKTVVIEEYGDKKKDEYTSRTRPLLSDMPTIVLVNEGSASASEIVAGALQDYKKATLVGAKTFGKGSVQDLKHLSDGSSIKLTVARWLTPSGRTINENGIQPDVVVELSDEDIEKKRDPQLEKAIELLKNPSASTKQEEKK